MTLWLCAACGGGALETATELPKAPRRPDGVVLEPPPAVPEPHDHATAGGVVGLRAPVADRDVEEVVASYFRAFVSEDLEALKGMLASGATAIGASSARASLVDVWRARFRNFEYQQLAGTEIYRPSEIERHTFDTLGSPGAPPRPPQMVPGDVLVRVPVGVANVTGEQLFGDVVVLLLRREDGHLRIAAAADESAH
ncbi:MAG: hypothetical protein KC657_15605 [Myxococcales bacterium]|nr:hypothetical protein [Myxococcales bacterium]